MGKTKSVFWTLSGLMILIIMLTGTYLFIEPYWIKHTQIDFYHKDIPPAFHGTSIVFVSDIHHGPNFSLRRVEKMVRKINRINPDIILLGGDYVDGHLKYIVPVFSALKSLAGSSFIGGVLGNHDHWESSKETREAMGTADIVLLDNSSYWVKKGLDRVKIGGVGDLWEDTQDISATIHDVEESDFVILVSHNPDYFDDMKTSKIDLVLSGHSHGGQVTFFGLFAPVLPLENKEYSRGFFRNFYSTLYVTTGIGTISPPIRFFARPEIVEFILKRE